MIKFECSACGGRLNENGKFYICENCGTKYSLGRDDEGQPFTYQPVEKKDIECGQMGVKANAIEVSSIVVREIKLKDSINVDVHNESLNLDTTESIGIVETYIKSSEWDAAQVQINKLLLADNLCAEAQWYSLMCGKKVSDERAFVTGWTNFSAADKSKLDSIIENSSPDFAKHIIDLMFNNAYANDSMCSMILSTILPYAKNDTIYSEKEFNQTISDAFDKVIRNVYEDSFCFLLTHTLRSDEVDRYIDYLDDFAGRCTPLASQKYYQMIIDVDPGNSEIRKKLIKADINADTDVTKCLEDFEGLLKYSKETDDVIEEFLAYLNSNITTTLNRSKFFWNLLGYHSKAPAGLKSELLNFAYILLNSSLWIEARNYLNLVLSVDSRNADAYLGLCLARLQARNTGEIAFKKENLIECSEFHKSLALYQADKNEAKVTELMSYTKKQKNAKLVKKMVIRLAIVIVVIIGLVAAFNKINYNRKYSVKNIVVSVEGKDDVVNTDYYTTYQSTLNLGVKNKSSLGVRELTGDMKIYNSDKDELLSSIVTLSLDVESGGQINTSVVLDPSLEGNIEEICYLDLENLKITLKINSVVYEDYQQKEYPESEEMVINKIKKSRSYKEEKADKIQTQYEDVMQQFEKLDTTSATAPVELDKISKSFETILTDVLSSEKLTEDMYATAENYKNDKEYEKAFFLFEILSKVAYKDSESKATECYTLALNQSGN